MLNRITRIRIRSFALKGGFACASQSYLPTPPHHPVNAKASLSARRRGKEEEEVKGVAEAWNELDGDLMTPEED